MAPTKGTKKRKQRENSSESSIRKPKRPMSAYNYFYKDEYARILAANTERGVKANFEDVAKLIGSRWRAMKGEALRSFEKRSEKDAERYREEMNVYYDKQNELRHAKYFKAEPKASENSPTSAVNVVDRDSPSPLVSEENSSNNGSINYQGAQAFGLPQNDSSAFSQQYQAPVGANLGSQQGDGNLMSNQGALLQALLAAASAQEQQQRQQSNFAASLGANNAAFPVPGMEALIAGLFNSAGGSVVQPQQQQQQQQSQYQDAMALQKALGLSNLLGGIQRQQPSQNSQAQLSGLEGNAADMCRAFSSGRAIADPTAKAAAFADEQSQRNAAQRASWQQYVSMFLQK